jgi:hypothetical protein
VISARSAGTRALLLGLAAAVVTGSVTAALPPSPKLRVHARLAPVGGMAAAGRFDTLLVRTGGSSRPVASPRRGPAWRLSWNASLPAFQGPATVSLRIAGGGAARVSRILCTGCGTRADGTVALTPSQVLRIARRGAVSVRARSASWRGTARVLYVARPR